MSANGNNPAHPSPIAINASGDLVNTVDHLHMDYHGLTKREEFAKAALQGLLASSYDSTGYDAAATDALGYADALLAALEQP